MKAFFRIIIMLALSVITYGGAAYAQQTPERAHLTREQLAQAQANRIAREMAMDQATRAKFVETYCQCQQEIWALGPRARVDRQSGQNPTNDQTEQLLKDRFARSQQVLGIRQKYYDEYSKFLTQNQILRIYELEKQIMNRLADPHKGRGGRSESNRR